VKPFKYLCALSRNIINYPTTNIRFVRQQNTGCKLPGRV